jgi:hypothetical protein
MTADSVYPQGGRGFALLLPSGRAEAFRYFNIIATSRTGRQFMSQFAARRSHWKMHREPNGTSNKAASASQRKLAMASRTQSLISPRVPHSGSVMAVIVRSFNFVEDKAFQSRRRLF